ncbi:uncharacterized protein LOC111007738 [Momordica charantia]|uniref:Uncharacterized protein LOC111007738 n=1 Tax=Momordica charantia TaxID=3673 RepID=A0A6J1C661_MOMCH|nr:uncharacterized protein LOC111007738 [Momordica charantia]
MQNENQQRVIRKAVSDLSKEIERVNLRNKNEVEEMMRSRVEEEEEVRQVECSCCGLKEECTAAYILEIQRRFAGKWVCGLCSEAVKERVLRFPNTPINEAINFHREFSHAFNTTTRLNPKLSLTTSMRKIARKSFDKRNSSPDSDFGSSTKLSRSISCDPRIRLND